MGYITDYYLDEPKNFTPEMIADLLNISDDFFEEDQVVDFIDEGIESKWYSFEEDFIKFSRLYPDIVFKISGRGEESEDIWACYFKNGLVQKEYAKIVIDPYDENKLK